VNTANQQAMIFVAPHTGTYTRIVMQITAKTIAAASTLIYGFQGITNAVANTPPGIPDGTWISSATVDANTFTVSNISTNYIELTGLSASLTKGTSYAIVMRPNTNWTAGYTLTVRAALSSTAEQNNVTWYHLNGTTPGTGIPLYGIGTSSTWYGYPAPFTAPTSGVIVTTAGQNNNQVGIKFRLPSTISTYKVRGWTLPVFRMGYGTDTAASVKIINAANTTLQTVTVDTNKHRTTQNFSYYSIEFTDTLATLSGGTDYYLVWETGNAANNDIAPFATHSDYVGQVSMIDHECVYRNSNTGAWTTTTIPTKQLTQGELILEDVTTAGGGGGGLIVHPGMAGGMRG
jgi:hypothetical protein